MNLNDNCIQKLPKTDLHLHLDGSLRIPTLIDLARESGVNLPSYSEEGLRDLVFKDKYENLEEYLTGFAYTCDVMRSQENIERISYELAIDNQNEGVRYIEVRFAPQLLIDQGRLSFDEIMQAVNRGLDRAKKEFNNTLTDPSEPGFEYGMIVCIMRSFSESFSPYYADASMRASNDSRHNKFQLAANELVKNSIRARDDLGLPIVGLDLAGQEDGFPAIDFKEAYDLANHGFLRKTVHAGEAYGADSIFQAVNLLSTDRIGHGYYLFDESKLDRSRNRQADKFLQKLVNLIADRRITIEVCLTSNLQTNPSLASISDHPFRKMIDHKISTTICTDNRLVSNTSVSKELGLAVKNFNLSKKELKDLLANGFKRSFFPDSYSEKRKYVRKVIDKIDSILGT